MIVSKTFEITTEDINAVVVDLADEIKKGYKIVTIETKPFTCSCDPRYPVVASIMLCKESER